MRGWLEAPLGPTLPDLPLRPLDRLSVGFGLDDLVQRDISSVKQALYIYLGLAVKDSCCVQHNISQVWRDL